MTLDSQDEGYSVGSIEFESPINKENSFHQWNLAENAKSKMELFYYKDNTGFIIWSCDELEMEEEIGLTFSLDANGKRTIEEYDGIFSLPDQAMDLLEKHGVDCKEMRRILAD
jgi:hypothetical protein